MKTDLGTEYINQVISELCKLLYVDHEISTAYHDESPDVVERNHRLLNEYWRSYLNGNLNEWEIYLKYFVFCYNTTQSSTNDHKYTPYELVLGHSVNFLHDILPGKIDPIYIIDNYVLELKFR